MQSLKQAVLLLQMEAKRLINRKKRSIPAAIVLIMLMISTFSYIIKSEEKADMPVKAYITLGIACQDSSEYAALLVSYFKDNPQFTEYVDIAEGEEPLLKKRFDDGELDCLLVIPEGFAERMIRMDHIPIRVWISTENATKALLLKTVLSSYETYITSVEVNCAALYDKMKADGFSYEELNQANIDISLELIFTALGKDSFFTRRNVEAEEETSLLTGCLYSACFLLVLFFCFPIGNRFQKMYRNGMTRRMTAAGISYFVLSVVCLLPYLMLSFLMAGVFLLLVPEKSLLLWGTASLLLLPILLLLAVFGVACRKKQTYLLLYSLCFVGLALAGGSMIPQLYLPEEFQMVTKWLPNYRFSVLLSQGSGGTDCTKTMLASVAVLLLLWGILLLLMKRRGEAAADEE
ncbi:MAG: ABC transporter permease [Lachnospiraceae bacterium]